MLTLTILITSWVFAAASFLGMLYMAWKREWKYAALAYVLTGFFLIALPFKVGMQAMSMFAVGFLSLIWPIWLTQEPFDYNLLSYFPTWFVSLLFNV